MGNDLLLYESRKRAIERVKRMQEQTENAAFKGEEKEPQKPDFNITGEENFKNNFGSMNNSFESGNNTRGSDTLFGNLFKGGGFDNIKEQINSISGPVKDIMDRLGLDSEKLIIIMIMWMLFNEKEDKTLLLALGYLLL